MSPRYATAENPLSLLGWRARWSWRRTARRIVAEHVDDLLSRLDGCRGLPVRGLATTGAGTVRVTLPDRAVTIVDVTSAAQAALSAAVEEHHCHVSAGGRYGRFWWLAVEHLSMGHLRRTVILGTRLVVTPIDDGHRRPAGPGWSPVLMAS